MRQNCTSISTGTPGTDTTISTYPVSSVSITVSLLLYYNFQLQYKEGGSRTNVQSHLICMKDETSHF